VIAGLAEGLRQVEADATVRVVGIRGAGDFYSGADLSASRKILRERSPFVNARRTGGLVVAPQRAKYRSLEDGVQSEYELSVLTGKTPG